MNRWNNAMNCPNPDQNGPEACFSVFYRSLPSFPDDAWISAIGASFPASAAL
jgi:hypothetical protein